MTQALDRLGSLRRQRSAHGTALILGEPFAHALEQFRIGVPRNGDGLAFGPCGVLEETGGGVGGGKGVQSRGVFVAREFGSAFCVLNGLRGVALGWVRVHDKEAREAFVKAGLVWRQAGGFAEVAERGVVLICRDESAGEVEMDPRVLVVRVVLERLAIVNRGFFGSLRFPERVGQVEMARRIVGVEL